MNSTVYEEEQQVFRNLTELLGSEHYDVRSAVAKHILQIGDPMRPALREALDSKDMLKREQSSILLKKMDEISG